MQLGNVFFFFVFFVFLEENEMKERNKRKKEKKEENKQALEIRISVTKLNRYRTINVVIKLKENCIFCIRKNK